MKNKLLSVVIAFSMLLSLFVPVSASTTAFDVLDAVNSADTVYQIKTTLENSDIYVPDLSDIYYPEVVYGSLIGQNFTSVKQITDRIDSVASAERENPKVALYCDGKKVSKPGKGENIVKIAPVTKEGIHIAAASYATAPVSPSDEEPFSVTYDRNHTDLKVYACSNGNSGSGMYTGMDVNASAWFGTDVPEGTYRITASVATDLDTSLLQVYVSSKTADFTNPISDKAVSVPCIDWFNFSECEIGVAEITAENRYVGIAVKGHCLRLSSITLTEIKTGKEYKAGGMKTVDLKEASTTDETVLSIGSLLGDEESKIIFLESMSSLMPLNAYDVFYDDKLDIYVDSSANNGGDGSRKKPFRTISEARDYVRGLIPSMTQDIRVNIADGDYYITEPLTFDENDGGRNGHDVIYQGSYGSDLPVINGGVPVSGWEEQSMGIYKAHVDGVTEARQFYIGGFSAERARSNEYYIAEKRYETDEKDIRIEIEDYADKYVHEDAVADGGKVYANSWTTTNSDMEFTITLEEDGNYIPSAKMGYCSRSDSFSGIHIYIDGTEILNNKKSATSLSGYQTSYGGVNFSMPIHKHRGTAVALKKGEHTVTITMDKIYGGTWYTFLVDSLTLTRTQGKVINPIIEASDEKAVYNFEDNANAKLVAADINADGGKVIGSAWTITNPDTTVEFTVEKSGFYDVAYKVLYSNDIGSYSAMDIILDGKVIGNNTTKGTALDGYNYEFAAGTIGARMHEIAKRKIPLTKGTHTLTLDVKKVNGASHYNFMADSFSIYESQNVTAGFYTSGYDLPEFMYPEDLELVVPILWSTHRLPVKDVVAIPEERRHIFVMDQPYYESYLSMICEGGVQPSVGTWFYIENDISFLDEPGEFWFDKETSDLYYYPRYEGELEKTAFIPVSEGLVRINGTSPSSKVSGLKFQNLAFANGAYNELSETGNCDFQADCMMPYDKFNVGPSTTGLMPPSQIIVNYADGIDFENCRMYNLGSGAVAMIKGVTDSSVTSCEINDISGTAIIAGTWSYKEGDASGEYSSDILIENNHIRRVGQELLGSPGLGVYYAKNVSILHNDIADAPYSGITIGWGWGASLPVTAGCGGHRIIGNRFDATSRLMRDGGAIYTNGRFPESGVLIKENYITDSPDFAAIYMDTGSSYITIEENVVNNMVGSSEYCWLRGNPSNGIIRNNYSVTDQNALSDKSIISGTTLVPDANWTGRAKEICEAAGTKSDLRETIVSPAFPNSHKAAWDYYANKEAVADGDILLEFENHNPTVNVGYFPGMGGGTYLPVTVYTRGKYRKLGASIHNGMWYKYDFTAPKAGKYRVEMRYTTGPSSDEGVSNNIVTIRAKNKNGSNLENVSLYGTATSTDAAPSVELGYLNLPVGENTLTFLAVEGWLTVDNIKLIHMGN